jgi:hypothetical protein
MGVNVSVGGAGAGVKVPEGIAKAGAAVLTAGAVSLIGDEVSVLGAEAHAVIRKNIKEYLKMVLVFGSIIFAIP